jgi:hypothetical protein
MQGALFFCDGRHIDSGVMNPRWKVAPALVACVFAAGALAQPLGPEFHVNTYTTGPQYPASVAASAQGFVVVWGSGNNLYTGSVEARRFALDGTPLGDEFVVTSSSPQYLASRLPRVGADAAGGFVVVWQAEDGPPKRNLFARRYDPSGAPLGDAFRVLSSAVSYVWRFDMAVGSNGDFVVAWGAPDQSFYGIWARRFASDGTAYEPEFQVNTFTPGSQGPPSVAIDDSGDFVVAWNRGSSSPGGSARFYDPTGVPRTGELPVTTDGSPRVAASGLEFLLLWDSYGTSYDVKAARFDNAGVQLAGPFVVNTYTSGTQTGGRAARDTAGGFVVTWSGQNGTAGDYGDVLARRFDATGAPKGAAFRVNTYTTSSQGSASIAMAPDGTALVVWSSTGTGVGEGEELFGQRVYFDPPLKGDLNFDGAVDVADVFYLINHLFAGGSAPFASGDLNGDRKVDVLDVFYLINHLFAGGPAPV